jgi:hypothetical protein
MSEMTEVRIVIKRTSRHPEHALHPVRGVMFIDPDALHKKAKIPPTAVGGWFKSLL